MAGVYESGGGVFDEAGTPIGGNIRLDGEPSRVSVLAADPEAPGPWPVKIRGKMGVTGRWVEIRGIEFESTGGMGFDGYPLSTVGSHITLRGNYIHGRPQDFGVPGVGYDCVKLSGFADVATGERSEDLRVLDNEIGTCPEDCFDIAGSGQDVVVRGNHIYGCDYSGVHVKGGAERVVIERNRIHDIGTAGISGMGGNCTPNMFGRCPNSAFLSTLPVEERFMARDVTVANNVLYALRGSAIEPRGWRDVRVYHNTIYGVSEAALRLGAAGWEFIDDAARVYCETHTCGACNPLTSDCWKIPITPRDIEVANNIIVEATVQIAADSDSVTGLVASHNLHFRAAAQLRFRLIGNAQDTYSLSDFPYEDDTSLEGDPGLADPIDGDFHLVSDALARDHAAPRGVRCDADGSPRCGDAPDIGAYEATDP